MNLTRDTADLLETYFAGDASPETMRAMEAWLREKPSHPLLLAEYGLIDRLIAHEEKNQDASAIFAALLEAEEAAETIVVDQSIPANSRAREQETEPITFRQACGALAYLSQTTLRNKAGQIAGLAALLVLSAILFVAISGSDADSIADNTARDVPAASAQVTPRGSDSGSDPGPVGPALNTPVATLTAAYNAAWAGAASSAPEQGDKLYANQRLTLTRGFAEITTARGAVAILEAPATFELTDSDNAVRLHAGKLVGICETESSKGFVVRTPHADVTDLGTEFGVTAHRFDTEATVFVGEVAVKAADAPSQVLTHSQTARISLEGDRPIVAVSDDKPAGVYAQRLPREPLITGAWINTPGFDVEFEPSALYEDARLFADRDHEINGIDAAGIHGFLLGGDVVRMPADAQTGLNPRTGQRLQLEIELSTLSDVYLLVRSDHVLGDWLNREYEFTGLETGVDFVGHADGTDYAGGVGPGRSVDHEHEIWKRKKPAVGRVVVGGPMSKSMYAVVAVPHRTTNP